MRWHGGAWGSMEAHVGLRAGDRLGHGGVGGMGGWRAPNTSRPVSAAPHVAPVRLRCFCVSELLAGSRDLVVSLRLCVLVLWVSFQ